MASIMLFPNKATHRRMPHLPKEPKEPKEPNVTLTPTSHASSCSSSFSSSSIHDLTPPHGRESAVTVGTGAVSGTTITENSDLSYASSFQSRGVNALTINTAPATKIFDAASSSAASAASDGLVSASVSRSPAMTPHSRDAKHSDQLHYLLNAPHSQCSAASTSTLSATAPSSPSTMCESRIIKSALYDAFGCLYHPVQHTHYAAVMPMTPQSRLSTSSSSSSFVAAGALRPSSNEVTLQAKISPRESPLALRPHMGTSAPITPLELSGDNHGSQMGGGYFALSTPSSHSVSSGLPPISCSSSSSCSSKYIQAHHHHHNLYYSHNAPSHAQHAPDDLDDTSKGALKNKPSTEFHLDPSEHPVLCSLHTLSLTHPHPPEHYHPHLSHDLGHDRVPISILDSSTSTTTTAATIAGMSAAHTSALPSAAAAATITSSSQIVAQPPLRPPSRRQQQQKQKQQGDSKRRLLTPRELLMGSTSTTAASTCGASSVSSVYPMNGRGEDESIGRLGQQRLM